jgi:hypothetical protein
MSRILFEPTDELRRKVRRYASYGLPDDDIALLAGCSAKTLRKHFQKELDTGLSERKALVADGLMNAVHGGNIAAGNVNLTRRRQDFPTLAGF